MIINVVFFSDSHLGFDYPIRPKLNIRRRGPDFFRNFNLILDYAKNNGVDLVIHGGDLFFRSKVPGTIIDKTYSALLTFAQSGIPIYIVPGNHERSELPQALLLQHPNIHIFSKPKTYILPRKDLSVSLSGFPCERRNIKGKFRELVSNSGWYDSDSDIKILCLHQSIEGACVGPSDYTFKTGEDVIPLTDLPGDASTILVGHIHRHQELFFPSRTRMSHIPILFSGSIERTSFAEKNETKGFYHLCFTNQEPGSWALTQKRFIPLDTRPMIDIQLDQGMTINQIEYTLVSIVQYQRDAIVRIKYRTNINPYLNPQLSNQWLREILPPTVSLVRGNNFENRQDE